MAQVQAPDVLRLQQELVEKERKLQNAITIAGQYQARVLDLEDRIDSKNDVKEKVKKLIHKFEQHKREITARQDNEQIEQENADLRRNETSLIATVKDLRGILRKRGADEALTGPSVIGNEEKEEPIVSEDDNQALTGPSVIGNEEKEEPIESEDDNQLSTRDSMEEQIEDDELLNDDVVSEIDGVDIREPDGIEIDSIDMDNSEYVDEIDQSEIRGNVPTDSMDDVLERDEMMEKTPGNPKELSVERDIEWRTSGRPARRASRAVKYNDPLEDSDGDETPPVKKTRTESEKKGKKGNLSKKESTKANSSMNEPKVAKQNATELECPECEFRTRSVNGWGFHLRRTHSTSPREAGLALRCDCGVDCFSDHHFRTCKSANATVINIRDKKESELVRRNDSELKCLECEFRTRSVSGWVDHLRKSHSTSPREAGLALRCDCGVDCFSENHFRTCKSANATVINIRDKKESELVKRNDSELECPECAYRTRSVPGWMDHLRRIHSTIPILAGLALRCDCGHEGTSEKHSRTCDSTNTTVILKKQKTPQCVLCEVYPQTVCGYETHLQRYHKTTLKENGIYLKCSCDFKVTSHHSLLNHKECNGRSFTVHELRKGMS